MIGFARRALFLAILVVFSLAQTGFAQEFLTISRRPILDQAIADHQAGKADLARMRIRHLLRSSPDAADEGFLLSLNDQIRRETPWFINGGLAVLPSSNIDRISAHRTFDTRLGQFQIPQGGAPRFGVGLWAWGEVGRAWVTAPGQEVSLSAQLARSLHPDAGQNRTDFRLALGYERHSRRGHWRIALTRSAGLQDGQPSGDAKADFDQLSLSVSGLIYLGPTSGLGADLSLGDTNFWYRDHQSGPTASLGLSFNRALDAQSNLGLKARLGRNVPRAGHLANTSAAFSVTLDRRFGDHLVLGGSAEIGASQFDANFPILGQPRRDDHLALGLSISDDRIRLFDRVPSLSCIWRNSRSNVALYEHQATDCQVQLVLSF